MRKATAGGRKFELVESRRPSRSFISRNNPTFCILKWPSGVEVGKKGPLGEILLFLPRPLEILLPLVGAVLTSFLLLFLQKPFCFVRLG